MELGWWDSQSGALFTSSSGMRAQAWWCHRHGNNSHCFRLQIQTFRWLQEAAAIHQNSKFFIMIPLRMIKSYTSHAFIRPLKQLRLLHRSLMCSVYMCVCVYIQCAQTCACVKSCVHQCACHDCVSKCKRDGRGRFASLPSPPAGFPQRWAQGRVLGAGVLTGRLSEQMPDMFMRTSGRRWNHFSHMRTHTHIWTCKCI